MDLSKLIADLEAADGPSRELDWQIVQALAPSAQLSYPDGWDEPIVYHADPFVPQKATLPEFTRSLDAATTLAEPGWQVSSGNCNEDNEPWACVTTPDNVDHTGDGAATETLARLIALLKARGK